MPGLDPYDAAAAEGRLPDALPPDPFPTFRAWFERAHQERIQPNPNSMALATVDPDGRPAVRIVLCKILNAELGYLAFFTNYTSRKGPALEANPRAAAVMHWDALELQVRVEGPVVRSPREESDAYFATRPWMSRVGAWASDQSRPVASRADMIARVDAAMRRFGVDPANPPPPDAQVPVPRPPHWGGYRLWAERVELWIGSAARLHDRAVWTRSLRPGAGNGDYQGGPWTATRLQP